MEYTRGKLNGPYCCVTNTLGQDLLVFLKEKTKGCLLFLDGGNSFSSLSFESANLA